MAAPRLAGAKPQQTAAQQEGERFRRLLARIGWPQTHLSYCLGRSPVTVSNWGSGVLRVPGPVVSWLEDVAEALDKLPPPLLEQKNYPNRKHSLPALR